ncbi:hypothetical protein EOA27_31465 [Mesorhizobium sp. M2A.F.Ca.ET.037.01.1.1]|uniref:hypothetical protein n=1 Tax=unclassified Mesorhizobium TaxID=325217 RepID=UPI000FC9FDEE|nr:MULTISPECIES: hypothetical protein [unclassified Mesorhizobium]RUY06154.1 hypothetical protein EOA25_16625 [Mesorhizobium sp. M2A.F.Ca.ET.040.01.1.1]RVC65263.1 hypothetical protein EN759_22780 [Mesorhizobium sp. M00.F.Ca.ET.038.03.1.1]RUX03086.1 hypothetical protein EOA27_31465 [Mesorhizobium sp. M2A.F.Ca.ET.037.01.1.1]RWA82411.1 MAG: hypothetical protein EOQ31_30355 [Mesorhizobium sp.]RWE89630.1 MAG: hypothetical protein EOS81_26835 [Mesorhizobium sp.]
MAANALVLFVSALVVAGAIALIALALRRRRKRRKLRRSADPAHDYQARANWSASDHALNYSSFVFMDVDGDGRFGEADRPMGGIVVRVFDDKGAFITSATSNSSGFANFLMSTGKRWASLRAPGLYRFSVSVPKGWRVSTGNESQMLRLVELPGSPAGLVGEDLPGLVGLVPGRSLRGKTPASAQVTLKVMGKGELLQTMPLAAGSFHFDLPDVADTLEISGPDIGRRLALCPYPTDLGELRPDAIADEAVLSRIGFDDVTSLDFKKVPSGHAGLEWRNINAIARNYVKESEGYLNGSIRGNHAAYTSSGHPAEFGGSTPFGFHSVMLTAAWLRSEGEVALIESWLGDELVASDEVVLSALAPVHYAPMLKAVTRVRVSTRHHWQLVLDDLVLAR